MSWNSIKVQLWPDMDEGDEGEVGNDRATTRVYLLPAARARLPKFPAPAVHGFSNLNPGLELNLIECVRCLGSDASRRHSNHAGLIRSQKRLREFPKEG